VTITSWRSKAAKNFYFLKKKNNFLCIIIFIILGP
jgi:hypothetical protein